MTVPIRSAPVGAYVAPPRNSRASSTSTRPFASNYHRNHQKSYARGRQADTAADNTQKVWQRSRSTGRAHSAPSNLQPAQTGQPNDPSRFRHRSDCPLALAHTLGLSLAGPRTRRCRCLHKYSVFLNQNQNWRLHTPYRVSRGPRIAPERKARVRKTFHFTDADLTYDDEEAESLAGGLDDGDTGNLTPESVEPQHPPPHCSSGEADVDADVDTDDEMEASTSTPRPATPIVQPRVHYRVPQGAAKRARKDAHSSRRKRVRCAPPTPGELGPSQHLFHAGAEELPRETSHGLFFEPSWDPSNDHRPDVPQVPDSSSRSAADELAPPSSVVDQSSFDLNFPPLGTSPASPFTKASQVDDVPTTSAQEQDPLSEPSAQEQDSLSGPVRSEQPTQSFPSPSPSRRTSLHDTPHSTIYLNHQDQPTSPHSGLTVTFQDGDGSMVCARTQDGRGVFGSDGEFERVPQDERMSSASDTESESAASTPVRRPLPLSTNVDPSDGDTTDDMGTDGLSLHVPRVIVGDLTPHGSRSHQRARRVGRMAKLSQATLSSAQPCTPSALLSSIAPSDSPMANNSHTPVSAQATPKMGTFAPSLHPQCVARRAIIGLGSTAPSQFAPRMPARDKWRYRTPSRTGSISLSTMRGMSARPTPTSLTRSSSLGLGAGPDPAPHHASGVSPFRLGSALTHLGPPALTSDSATSSPASTHPAPMTPQSSALLDAAFWHNLNLTAQTSSSVDPTATPTLPSQESTSDLVPTSDLSLDSPLDLSEWLNV